MFICSIHSWCSFDFSGWTLDLHRRCGPWKHTGGGADRWGSARGARRVAPPWMKIRLLLVVVGGYGAIQKYTQILVEKPKLGDRVEFAWTVCWCCCCCCWWWWLWLLLWLWWLLLLLLLLLLFSPDGFWWFSQHFGDPKRPQNHPTTKEDTFVFFFAGIRCNFQALLNISGDVLVFGWYIGTVIIGGFMQPKD